MKAITLKDNISIDFSRRIKSFYSGGNEYVVYKSECGQVSILVEWEEVNYDEFEYYVIAVADNCDDLDSTIQAIFEDNVDYDMNL